MAFRAFLDTCVLFSATLNDTLLRIAELGAFQPLWSQGVLRELRTVLQREAHISPDAAGRRIANMQRAFADADVSGYESLIPAMTCDGKDRHVLAATIRGNAELLITFNVKDFPASSTDPIQHCRPVTRRFPARPARPLSRRRQYRAELAVH